MAKCGYCGSTIIMGGVRSGDQRFCNNKCHQSSLVLGVAQQIPPDVIERQVEEIWRGNCPKCRALGPVDVHQFHEVWSIGIMTRWTSTPRVCCRSCATKRQAGALVFSLFCGWWGFPRGLVLTPVQISRNVAGMFGGPDSSKPSAALQRLVRVNLGLQAIQRSASQAPPVQKPPTR
jgi:hypothetical protein